MGLYNNPNDTDGSGSPVDSTIGTQFRTDHYQKKALIEIRKEQYFSPLADVVSMPKHFGKKIKRYHYLPILDDANINDQGIDAAGLTGNGTDEGTVKSTIIIQRPDVTSTGNGMVWEYAVGEDITFADSLTAAESAAMDIFKALGVFDTSYAATVTALEGLTPPWIIDDTTHANTNAVPSRGNLYGSSKDVGVMLSKMPTLAEEGGRVNRVGFTRVDLEGTIEKYGMFYDYTKESLDFDTDSELDMHCTRELLNAGNEVTEDLLQINLLSSAGVVRYGGDATTTSEITGENGTTPSLISYEDLMRLEIDLDQNRCPKQTKVITGTRMVDTRVVAGARYMFIGSELIPTIKRMTDLFGNQAFIGVEHYAGGGSGKYGDSSALNGEIGAVGGFRIVVVPEMAHWAGVGASVTTNDGYRETAGNYDVFPMLVVGDASFTTIGFQTDGKTTKFKIKNVKPESDSSYDRVNDPFGEMGFSSLKFYFGFMVLRPERIALCKSVAEY